MRADRSPATGRSRVVGRLAVLVLPLLVSLATGCGVGLPREVGPRGVDGLVVPTPSPDPADFVEVVDNPWLPLAPGSRWRYRVVPGGGEERSVTVTVLDERRDVAGVPTTVVRHVTRGRRGEVLRTELELYAQDVEGNVWWFGEEPVPVGEGTAQDGRSWTAGVDGARAGLAMAALPRVGDGYEQAAVPGVAEDRARVLDLTASRATPYGAWDDLLEVERTSPLEPATVRRELHARGVGLVLDESAGAGPSLELVAFSPGS